MTYTFSNLGFDENNFNDSLQISKRDECKNILNYIQGWITEIN